MGYRSVRTSDISGEELADSEVVTVNVKSEGKVFDAKADELKAIKSLSNVIELELKMSDGTTQRLLTTEKDFYAVVPRAVVENADNSRGRRSGYRPGNGS